MRLMLYNIVRFIWRKTIKKPFYRVYGYVASRKSVDKEEDEIVRKISKDIEFFHAYDVETILRRQCTENTFCRLDIIVRLLAVENEYGLNEYGWELYRKLAYASQHETEKRVEQRVNRFKKLISDWEACGYDSNSYIILGANFGLRDGSHRLALAIYHGLREIKCGILGDDFCSYYGMKWFESNGFTNVELDAIKKRADSVFLQD